MWINERVRLRSDLPNRKVDDLLELSNRLYRSEYYAKWLNQLYAQTPSGHPDKELLLAAIQFHRDSVCRTESVKRRNDIIQRVLANKPSGSGVSLLSKVSESQDFAEDDSPDDADFTELCDRFRTDESRLDFLIRDLKDYCGHVGDYCDRILVFPSSLELFMSLQPGPYPDIESKWVNFAVSFRTAFKEDLSAELNVRRPQGPKPPPEKRGSVGKVLTRCVDWQDQRGETAPANTTPHPNAFKNKTVD